MSVVVSAPTKLEEGQSATVTGHKFLVQKLAVTTTTKLKAEESLDGLTGKKKKK